MMETNEKIIHELILENGFEIDLDEGWQKLTTSQFGGTPGRAFSELIQNAIDSYPASTPWEARRGEIKTTSDTISITDWGEGMDVRRLSLLTTAGGTDKLGDNNKIGQFGLGFISIFNPNLGTERVSVITKCQGHTVELIFYVTNPSKRPEIKLHVLDREIGYSTRIFIKFNKYNSVGQCLDYVKKSLNYYPCTMYINGSVFNSVWQKKNKDNSISFEENGCKGVISKGHSWLNFNLLCKYELIANLSVSGFITGCHNMKYNLEDFSENSTAYVSDVEVVLNVDKLRLTISRDNYYLDQAYYEAKNLLNRKLRYFLFLDLVKTPDNLVIIANQFILRHEIRDYIANPMDKAKYSKEENKVIVLLAETPVYHLNGRRGLFSLASIKRMLSRGYPLYYSPDRSNLRWLGGSFKHDFVVIPEECKIISGAPMLFDYVFKAVFHDVVNLDKIMNDTLLIQELVERGLVNKSALSPACKILGSRDISSKQNLLLEEIQHILKQKEITEIIGKNLHLSLRTIKPVFFSVRAEGAYLSTGVFDNKGRPVNEDFLSNMLSSAEEESPNRSSRADVLLGLNLDHPFINYLTECRNPHRGYYALTYLSHELALCQKMLVPYSPFYHLVKEKLAQDMRKVLMKSLLSCMKN